MLFFFHTKYRFLKEYENNHGNFFKLKKYYTSNSFLSPAFSLFPSPLLILFWEEKNRNISETWIFTFEALRWTSNTEQLHMKPTPLGNFFLGENRVLLKQLLQNQADPLRPGHTGTRSSFVKRRISTTSLANGVHESPPTCVCAMEVAVHRLCRATHDAYVWNTITPVLMQPNWQILK